jgi:hypothetical protein
MPSDDYFMSQSFYEGGGSKKHIIPLLLMKGGIMKYRTWYLTITIGFLALSVIFYLIQISIFHRSHDTLYYFFQDLSFVPINVLLVTLILDRLLKKREKQTLLNKMNMVIGVFFNDVGTDLIKLTGSFMPNISEVNSGLQISAKWNDKDFNVVSKNFKIKPDQFVLDGQSLDALKDFLEKKKDGLLDMLANPNLLEHDTFTNLLWAVFHVADELAHRPDLNNLPGTDLDHLRGDILRAYLLIVAEWAAYMKHLKKDYPYLFSLAVRTNPFNPEAEITVT